MLRVAGLPRSEVGRRGQNSGDFEHTGLSRKHASESLRAVTDSAYTLIAPQRLHWVRAAAVSDHIERRAWDLEAVADPRAFVANLPAW